MDLSGKVAVVTGAAGGIGAAIASAFAKAGAKVVLGDIQSTKGQEVSNQINAVGGTSAFVEHDTTDEKAWINVIDKAIDTFGGLNILVNNAAIEQTCFIENIELADIEKLMKVNVTGVLLGHKQAARAMKPGGRAGKGGSIVNISSDLGLIAPDQRLYRKPGLPEGQQPVKPVTYSVVKSGLLGLTRYIATYWTEQGVRCNALCPGGIENNQDPTFLKEVCARIPMGRLARVDEYQGALLFLLSDASSYMNGSVISIDGGRTTW